MVTPEPSRAPERLPGKVVPLFPLPDVWLFPGVILPLHIFEERYRQMIEDSLDGPGRLVLGTLQAGHEGDSSTPPPVYPIAGLGEIGRHERLPDGRFNILLVGLARVRIREVPSERLYRKVETYPVQELAVTGAAEAELRKELLAALAARTPDLPEIPPEFTTGHLADMLVLRMPLAHERLNALYSELDAEQRARTALLEHARHPLDPT